MEMSIVYHFLEAHHQGWYLKEPYSNGFTARHARPRSRKAIRRVARAIAIPAILAFSLLGSGTASASPAASHACGWRCYPRNEALDWALTQKGCWYAWGGMSCSQGFDCSGLVVMAYRHAGFDLPRTTYEILDDVGVRHSMRHGWWELVQVSHPERGDLDFYGTGHVELGTKRWHETFGAHDAGTRVSYAQWSDGWHPTEYLRVVVHLRR